VSSTGYNRSPINSPSSSRSSLQSDQRGLIGRVVSKRFPNRKKPYLGKVVSYSNDENDNEYYKIKYNSDSDSEEMTEKEVEKILVKE
jgi:hypothetical protein